MYVPDCLRRRARRIDSRSSSSLTRLRPDASARVTEPVDVSRALLTYAGPRVGALAPARPTPTAAVDRVRRERRNVPRGRVGTSDQRGIEPGWIGRGRPHRLQLAGVTGITNDP